MFNILKNKYLRFKTHEDFFFEFFNNPQHKWINEDRYIKANFEEYYIALGILVNLVIVFAVLKSLNFIERMLGPGGLLAVRKFFGVILLAIAVKIFSSNVGALRK